MKRRSEDATDVPGRGKIRLGDSIPQDPMPSATMAEIETVRYGNSRL